MVAGLGNIAQWLGEFIHKPDNQAEMRGRMMHYCADLRDPV